ncbi:TOMM precursor leader peptide-binding protein [Streptomyces argenteolus]|uniref:TOMM precursor leader peptide-binding protein n=1 Tax=Streptomyces sp. NPDC025273 TaxID=3155251 RepID=UPI0033EE8B72
MNAALEWSLSHTGTTHGEDVEAAFAGRPDVVVASIWRSDHLLCERADELAHASGVPWLPVVLDHSVLRIGPFVAPGDGPCFRCLDQRRIQHDHQWDSSHVLRAAYERDRTLGPEGFLPQHARLAAGAAARLLNRAASGIATAGQVVTIQLSALTLSLDRVVAVHGCDRCREAPVREDLISLLRLGGTETVRA